MTHTIEKAAVPWPLCNKQHICFYNFMTPPFSELLRSVNLKENRLIYTKTNTDTDNNMLVVPRLCFLTEPV